MKHWMFLLVVFGVLLSSVFMAGNDSAAYASSHVPIPILSTASDTIQRDDVVFTINFVNDVTDFDANQHVIVSDGGTVTSFKSALNGQTREFIFVVNVSLEYDSITVHVPAGVVRYAADNEFNLASESLTVNLVRSFGVTFASTVSSTSIVLGMSSELGLSTLAPAEFEVTGVESGATVDAAVISDDNQTITLTLSAEITDADIPLISYAAVDDNAITSVAIITLESFDNQGVTNFVDNTGPVPTILSDIDLSTDLPIPFTVLFDESVNGFDAADIVTSSGGVEDFSSAVHLHLQTISSGNGDLRKPRAIAANSTGHIFIADTDQNRIQIYDSQGNYLDGFGSGGTETGSFLRPISVAIGPDDKVYVSDVNNGRVQVFDNNNVYLDSIDGTNISPGTTFDRGLRGVAVDHNNRVFLIHSTEGFIHVFDGNDGYSHIKTFGDTGNLVDGTFNTPADIDVGADGRLYVSDQNRVQVFNNDGTFISKFSVTGNGAGIALDSDTNIYIIDSAFNKVELRDQAGTDISEITGAGPDNAALQSPSDVALDYNGKVYVANSNNNSVEVYSEFTAYTFNVTGYDGDSQLTVSVAESAVTDDDGNLSTEASTASAVIDNVLPTVSDIFNLEGDADAIGLEMSEPIYANNIPADSFTIGNTASPLTVTAVEIRNATNAVVLRLSAEISAADTASGTLSYAPGVNNIVDIAGNALAAFTNVPLDDSPRTTLETSATSPTNTDPVPFIARFTKDVTGFTALDIDKSSGTVQNFTFSTIPYIQSIGGPPLSSDDGRFGTPKGIMQASDGRIYVVDSTNHRVQIFDSQGRYLKQFGTEADGDGEFSFPSYIIQSTDGEIYVSDTSNNRIQVFDIEGEYQRQFSTFGNETLNSPEGIMQASDGDIYVADTFNAVIRVFTTQGVFVKEFGERGAGQGQFDSPRGIMQAANGDIYVTDFGLSKVQIFYNNGTSKSEFGTSGSGNGDFNSPQDIMQATDGRIYIVDSGNNRVQIFNSTNQYDDKFSTISSQSQTPIGIMQAANENIYVTEETANNVQIFSPSPGYAFEISGPTDQATLIVNIPFGVADDDDGNTNYLSNTISLDIDRVAPTVLSINTASTTTIQIKVSESLPSSTSSMTSLGFTVSGVSTSANVTAVDVSDTTITLTLSAAITEDDVPGLAYAADSGNLIADAAGNALASFGVQSVTNNIDITVPTVSGISVVKGNATSIELEISEPIYANNIQANSFTIGNVTSPPTVTTVSITNDTDTITLTLSAAVADTDRPNLTYAADSGNPIADAAGNALASFSAQSVNNEFDITAPTVSYISLVEGDATSIELEISEPISANTIQADRFTIENTTSPLTVTAVDITNDTRTITLTLSAEISDVDIVSGIISFTSGVNDIIDASGNALAAFSNISLDFSPFASLETSATSPTNLNPIPFSVSFNNGVTGFTIADINATSGTVQNFASPGWVISHLQTIGEPGVDDGQFNRPYGIAINSTGYIYVVDNGNNRVQIFDSDFEFVGKFGESGTTDGKFNGVDDIAIDSNDDVYVTDVVNDRIQKFTSNGTYQSQFGVNGSSPGDFDSLSGIAINSTGYLYVSDFGNDRIQIFDGNGTYQGLFESVIDGTRSGAFNGPGYITIDSDDNIYVSEDSNLIRIFTSNGTYRGPLVAAINNTHNVPFDNPADMALDSNGNIYVVNSRNPSVYVLNSDGTYQTRFDGTTDGVDDKFRFTTGIAIDSDDNIYVTAGLSHVVQKFTPSPHAAYTFEVFNSTDQDTLTVNIPADVSQDLKNNTNRASNMISLDTDRVAPTVSSVTTVNTPSITLEISEPIYGKNITTASFAVSGASANPVVTAVEITNNTSTITLTLSSAVSIDDAAPLLSYTANNTNPIADAAASPLASFDNVAISSIPMATISPSVESPTNLDPVPFTVSFNQDVTGFVAADISTTSGTVGNLVQLAAPNTASYNFTVSDPIDQTILNVTIPAGTVQNSDGDDNVDSNTASIHIDRTGPTISLAYTTTAAPRLVILGISEPVFGKDIAATSFTVSGVNTNATVTAVDILNGTSTIRLTLSAEITASDDAPTVTYTPGTNTLTDIVGNTFASITFNIITDPPATFILSGIATDLTNLDTVPFTVYFEELVTGFTQSDIVATIGTVTSITPHENLHLQSVGDGRGSANGTFTFPEGIAVSSDGNIYITDTHNNRIQIFDKDGAYLSQFGERGTADGQFNNPYGLEMDSNDNVYVTDANNHRIQIFDKDGAYLSQFGGEGSTDGKFNLPIDIAINSTGHIFVADSRNYRVQIFDSSGIYISQFGGLGPADSQFSDLNSVATNSAGDIYVSDASNIKIFDKNEVYKDQIRGSDGDVFRFDFIDGVAVDPDNGRIYVSDGVSEIIAIFHSNGTHINTFGLFSAGAVDLGFGKFYAISYAGHSFQIFTQYTAYAFDVTGLVSEDILNVHIPANSAFNADSVGTAVTDTISITVDIVAPTVSSVSIATIQSADANNAIVIELSEPVMTTPQFDETSFTISSATATFVPTVSRVLASGNTLTLALSGSISTSVDNLTLSFEQEDDSASPVITDVAGNALASFSNIIDTPITSFLLTDISDPTNLNIIPFTARFSENLVGFAASDISVSSGTAQNIASIEPYVQTIGESGSGNGQFDAPRGIAMHSNGTIYVADSDNDRIEIFDGDGNYINQFGGSGTTDGMFRSPSDVALNSTNHVYVVDKSNNRVEIFDGDGMYLAQFDGSSSSSGSGQFNAPKGITIQSNGTLYIADTNNHLVKIFDSNGVYLRELGSTGTRGGSANGEFSSPSDVKLDAAGNIYVVDTGNHRIQIFNNTGTYLTQFGTQGTADGQLSSPETVALDAAGNIYVADTGNHRIQIFDSNGLYQRQIGQQGSANAQFNSPQGIALGNAASGLLYVTDTENHRIQILSTFVGYTFDVSAPDPNVILTVQIPADGDGNGNIASNTISLFIDKIAPSVSDQYLSAVNQFTLEASEQVIVGSSLNPADFAINGTGPNARVATAVELSSDGRIVITFSPGVTESDIDLLLSYTAVTGTGPDYLITDVAGNSMQSIASASIRHFPIPTLSTIVTSPANLDEIPFVVEFSRNVTGFTAEDIVLSSGTIQNFQDGEFSYVDTIASFGNGLAQTENPGDIAISSAGIIYLPDINNNRVLVFDSQHRQISKFGGNGTADGRFDGPRSIALDEPKGEIYVLDSGHDRIQIFDYNGNYLRQFGSSGAGNGAFNSPAFIKVTSDRVYVADTLNNRIQVFDKGDENGLPSFELAFGESGTADGQFSGPRSLAVNSTGHIFVSDSANGRIQIFDSDGNFLSKFGAYSDTNTLDTFDFQVGIDIHPVTNDIYIADSGHNRIKIWERNVDDGSYTPVLEYGFGDAFGSSIGEFAGLSWITIHPITHDLYLSESTNNRLTVFTSIDAEYAYTFNVADQDNLDTLTVNVPSDVSLAVDSPSEGNQESATISLFISGNVDTDSPLVADVEVIDVFQKTIRVKLTEPVSASGVISPQDFAVYTGNSLFIGSTDGAGIGRSTLVDVTAVELTDNTDILTLTLSTRLSELDNPYLSYTADSAGDDNNSNTIITDASGNQLTSFADYSIEYPLVIEIATDVTFPTNLFDIPFVAYVSKIVTGFDINDVQTNFRGHPANFRVDLSPLHAQTLTSSNIAPPNTTLDDPQDILISPDDRLYAVDSSDHNIKVFSTAGLYINQFGSFGSGDGQFNNPAGIAQSSNGTIYITDSGNHRVEIFHSNGTYISQFGVEGTGDGQLNSPKDIAINSTDHIYIADSQNNRIQIFDSDGQYISQFGSEATSPGSDNGQFDNPQDISIDSNDNVYVSDSGNNRVQIFDNSNTYQRQFGSFGSGDGQFNSTRGIAIDSTGNYVYVADFGNDRVQVFDKVTDEYIREFNGEGGTFNVIFDGPVDVHLTSDGSSIFVSNSLNKHIQRLTFVPTVVHVQTITEQVGDPIDIMRGIDDNLYILNDDGNIVKVYDNDGNYLDEFGGVGTGDGQFNGPRNMAQSSDGTIYVTDSNNGRIQTFDGTTYAYKSQFGIQPEGDFAYLPSGIAISSTDTIYVTDPNYNRVHVFNSDHQLLNTIGGPRPSGDNGKFTDPRGIAIDGDDNVYVIERQGQRVQIFDSNNAFVGKFDGGRSGFLTGHDIGVTSSGEIYVSDINHNRVSGFDSSGNLFDILSLRDQNGRPSPYKSPLGILIDDNDELYIADDRNNRVGHFASTMLSFTPELVQMQTITEQLNRPRDIMRGIDGNLYIIDNTDRLVKVYDNDGNYLDEFGGGFGTGDGQFRGPRHIAQSSDGTIYVTDSSNGRIQAFDGTTYAYKSQFGIQPEGDFEYIPSGIAINSIGHIYVADPQYNRVHVFDRDHQLVSTIGGPRPSGDNGKFTDPRGIAIDGDDNVYVIEGQGRRVQVFDSNNAFMQKFDGGRSGFLSPSGVAVTSSGEIYTSDLVNNRISGFDSRGNIFDILSLRDEDGRPDPYNRPRGIMIDDNDNIYVADSRNDRVAHFAFTVVSLSDTFINDARKIQPRGMIQASDDNFYIVEGANNHVLITDAAGNYIKHFGEPGSGDGQFGSLADIAQSRNGTIYVSDGLNNRVQIFDSDGVYLSQFGSKGSGDGQFRNPAGIAIDNFDRVYVTDQINSRVQVFDRDGVYLRQFGNDQVSSSDGLLNGPRDVEIDDDDLIFVSDTQNHRIQVFRFNSTTGVDQYVRQFGSLGSGPGELDRPSNIAIDSLDNVYVTDFGNDRVQVFDINGGHSTHITGDNTAGGDGRFSDPAGIVLNSESNIYVADSENNRIQIFGQSAAYNFDIVATGGTTLGQPFPVQVVAGAAVDDEGRRSIESNIINIEIDRTTPNVLDFDSNANPIFYNIPTTLLLRASEPVFVVDGASFDSFIVDSSNDNVVAATVIGAETSDRFIRLTLSNSLDSTVDNYELSLVMSGSDAIVDIAGNGLDVFDGHTITTPVVPLLSTDVTSPTTLNVIPFELRFGENVTGFDAATDISTTSGTVENVVFNHTSHIKTITSAGNTTLNYPRSVAIGPQGDVYVTDNNNDRMIVFDSDGQYLREFDASFDNPRGSFAINSTGHVIISSTQQHLIQVYNNNDILITQLGPGGESFTFGESGSLDGQFDEPGGIAYFSGKLYIVDSGNSRIQILNASNGEFISKFGEFGLTDDGDLNFPIDIAIDRNGHIYVVDSGNSRIQIFDSDGEYLRKFGSRGTNDGEFTSPQDIAIAPDGRIYITDSDNARIQLFNVRDQFVTKFTRIHDGTANEEFGFTRGIAAGSDNRVYFTESEFGKIRIFTPDLYTFDIVNPANSAILMVNVPANSVFDANSVGNTASEVVSVSVGITRPADPDVPSVTIATSATNPTNANPVPFTINFSEPVTGFTARDITTSSGIVQNLSPTPSQSATSYTFNVESSADGAVLSVSMPAGVVQDIDGNANPASNIVSVSVDRAAPTVTAASVTDTSTIQLVLSEPVFANNVTAGDFAITGVTGGNPTVTAVNITNNTSMITLTISPSISESDTALLVSYTLGTNRIADAAANPLGSFSNQAITNTLNPVTPTVTIATSATNQTNADPIPFTITFSEPVTGFTASDITATIGTVQNLSPAPALSVTSYTFNVAGSTDGATLSVSMSANTVQDTDGNNNAASNTVSVSVDRAAPTVTAASVADTSTIRLVLSESVFANNVTPVDFAITGATGSNPTVTAVNITNNTSIITLTLSAPISDSDTALLVSYTPGTNRIADAATNPLGSFNNQAITNTLNPVTPTVTIATSATNPTNANPISFTIDFSEPVTGFTASDITATTGTVQNLSPTPSQPVTSYTFNVAGSTDGATLSVSMSAGMVQDTDNNANTASNTVSVSVDRTAPAVTSISAINQSTIQLALSEPVFANNVTPGDFAITGVAGGNPTVTAVNITNNTSMITLTISPSISESDTALLVSYIQGTNRIADAATNPLGSFGSQAITEPIDFTMPTVTIATSATNPTNANSVPFTINFSEPVTGFTASDITVSSGTVQNLSPTPSLSATSYTFNVAGSTDRAVLSVSMSANTVQDTNGNANTASNTVSVSVDRTVPTVTAASVTDTSTIRLVLSESVFANNVTPSDFAITGATGGNPTVTQVAITNNTSMITLTLSPSISESDTGLLVSYTPGTNRIADAAANPLGSFSSQGITNTLNPATPTVTIATSATNPTNVDPVPFTINFSESVTGFTASDITVSSGTVQNISPAPSQSIISYTFNVASPADGVTLSVSMSAGTVQDTDGNANAASNTVSVSVDRTAPIITSTSVTDTSTIQLVLSESVFANNVTPSDFVITGVPGGNPTVTQVTITDNTNRVTLTLSAPITGSDTGLLVSYTQGTNHIADAATNPLASFSNQAITNTLNPVTPTVTIATSATNPTNTDPVPFTINFSKQVTGFTASDITTTTGTVQNLSPTPSLSVTSYTFTVADLADGVTLSVSMSANTVQDTDGNANAASNTVSVSVDRTAPIITSTTVINTSTIQLVLSEPVFANNVTPGDFVTSGVAGSNPTVTQVTVTDNTNRVTLTLSPSISDSDTALLVSYTPGTNRIADAAANPLASFSNQAITNTLNPATPTVTIATSATNPTNADPIPFTINFSKPVTGFTASDITVSSGTVQNISPASSQPATSYTFTVASPADGATLSVSMSANTVQDTDGNANAASNTASISVDRTAPTVTSTTVVDTSTIRLVLSELVFANGIVTPNDFTITGVPGGNPTVTQVAITNNIDRVTLTLSAPIPNLDTALLVSYTQGTNRIADAATNQLASFSNQGITRPDPINPPSGGGGGGSNGESTPPSLTTSFEQGYRSILIGSAGISPGKFTTSHLQSTPVTFDTGVPSPITISLYDNLSWKHISHLELCINKAVANSQVCDTDTKIIWDQNGSNDNNNTLEIIDPHNLINKANTSIRLVEIDSHAVMFDFDVEFANVMDDGTSILQIYAWDTNRNALVFTVENAFKVVAGSSGNTDGVGANNNNANTADNTGTNNIDVNAGNDGSTAGDDNGNSADGTNNDNALPVSFDKEILRDWTGSTSTSISDAEFLTHIGVHDSDDTTPVNEDLVLPNWTKDVVGKWALEGKVSSDELKNMLSYMYILGDKSR